MKPSQERIALQLGIAFDLSAADAAKILKEVAGAIRAIGPSDGKLVQMQEQRYLDIDELFANNQILYQ